MKSVINKKNGLIGKKVFPEFGVANANREERCRILRALAKYLKRRRYYHLQRETCKPAEEIHEKWFRSSNFTEECWDTLNESEDCATD